MIRTDTAALVATTILGLPATGWGALYLATEGRFVSATVCLLAFAIIAGWFGFVVGVGPPMHGER